MNKPPFGFSAWDGADNPGEGGPFGNLFGQSSGFGAGDIGKIFSQIGETFHKIGQAASADSNAPIIDYSEVVKAAKKHLHNVKSPSPERQKAVADAVRLAELWLDESTSFPTGITTVAAFSSADWLDHVAESLRTFCDPMVERVADVWKVELPAQEASMLAPFMAIFSRIGGIALSEQLSSGLGNIASDVLAGSEIGIPLGPLGTAALLTENIASFSADLEQPSQEVLVYLAAREAAHHRLFTHLSWLKPTLVASFEGYARGIDISLPDQDSFSEEFYLEAMQNPEKIRELLNPANFELQPTEKQKQELARLEHLLALVEGWVRVVVTHALGDRIPSTFALDETMRRRAGGMSSTEKAFTTLLGLPVKPQKINEVVKMWSRVGKNAGIDVRDSLWNHPDLLPTPVEVENPAQVIERLLHGEDISPLDGE